MELVPLTEAAYQLRGGTNAGLIVHDGRAVLVDTGLDRDTAKKILRHIESLKIALAAVIITHAHADHFGGAATIRTRTGASVYAPALEADVVASPIWEPLYLFSGALPPSELRHKFTLAEPCPVTGVLGTGDQVLGGVPFTAIPAPGHSPNQMMIAGGGVCFVADACFAPEILHKHGIPFYVDIDQTLASLDALLRWMAPTRPLSPATAPRSSRSRRGLPKMPPAWLKSARRWPVHWPKLTMWVRSSGSRADHLGMTSPTRRSTG